MLHEELAFARTLVQEAAALLRRMYREGAQRIGHKSSLIDLVTEADMASERLLLSRLQERFPDDAILGEETGAHGTGKRRWIFDPLDGTTNFAHRLPIFGVSLALVEDETILLGVTCDVTRQRLYWAPWAAERGPKDLTSPPRVPCVSRAPPHSRKPSWLPASPTTRPPVQIITCANLLLSWSAARACAERARPRWTWPGSRMDVWMGTGNRSSNPGTGQQARS